MKYIFALLSLLFAFLSIPALASVTVTPVHLNIQHGERSTFLQIQNPSDHSATLDLRVFKWLGQNADGEDLLEKTDNVILSRPVVIVPANSTTTVRLIVHKRSGKSEDSYRVLVDDITPNKPGIGMAIKVNSVLPFFILNTSNSSGVLEKVGQSEFKNTGDRHVRITYTFTAATGDKIVRHRYLMPGQSINLDSQNVDDIVWSDSVF